MNLTDGLDGLVAGSAAMVMGAYTLLTFIQFRSTCYRRAGAVAAATRCATRRIWR